MRGLLGSGGSVTDPATGPVVWASIVGVLAVGASAAWGADRLPAMVETPMLAPLVKSGRMPPVAARIPQKPAITRPALPGRHGGDLTLIAGRSKDTRLMTVYGYARLVGYDRGFRLHADILEGFEVEEGRRFTLHLRPGHRWSDGHPFTAEDFRYYWDDVAGNSDLSPTGLPRAMIVRGEKPVFEVLGLNTVRYSWSRPNPAFLPALAGARPLYIYRPAHYLRRFHVRHAEPAALAVRVAETQRRDWADLHNAMDNQYKSDNPDLPTLQPWVVETKPPSKRYVFVRNPFYHRVDSQGRQLPYIDRVMMSIVSSGVIPLKTGAGESDLQSRGLRFSDYTFLKAGEKDHGYKVRLWTTAKSTHLALFPNLNASDPEWRRLLRDRRFRRALSLAINRHEINQVIYYGLALEGNNSVLPASPVYRQGLRESWAAFDLKQANALLDEIGLIQRDSRGIRLLADGRPLEVIVETAGESTEQTDVLELISDSWSQAGIKLYSRPTQREVFRNRIFAGSTTMSIWSGWENGLPTAADVPGELAPTRQVQLQWPKWGQHFETRSRSGEAVDMPAAQELLALYRRWVDTDDSTERARIWNRMLQIHADNVFIIGLIAAVPQPVVVGDHLRNVPGEAVYNWNPGAQFGIYRPDTFWLTDAPGRES